MRSGHTDPVVALVASNVLGRLPAELTGEPGDTPPMAAATFLAQLTGAPIDPKATIEGELVLDGTIAPPCHHGRADPLTGSSPELPAAGRRGFRIARKNESR